ncbi:hypothetical protein MMC20_000223 [Loxospora ochrophaea]|nr:hypothetical protein [Loxospora ochrophaea]
MIPTTLTSLPALPSASIILVFTTSNGVVAPAATPPLTQPAAALSHAVTSAPPLLPSPLNLLFRLTTHPLIPSHSGNCTTVNGTSLATVIPHPLYISLHTPLAPISLRSPHIALTAAIELVACDACARCFTTSVGTRTAHAAISPTEAAVMLAAAPGGESWPTGRKSALHPS